MSRRLMSTLNAPALCVILLDMEQQEQHHYSGVITKKLQLTKTVYQFVIYNTDPKELYFQPGQYAAFIIDETTRRQYSFCSAPDPISFELVVDVFPMGPGSKYFLEKKEGDRAEYLAPLGNFTLQESVRKKIFVATGTGIAPFRSMLLGLMENGKWKMPACRRGRESVSLYWGLRFEEDVYREEEMKGIVGHFNASQFYLCLSKPGEKWTGLVGHVTEHVLENEKDLQSCDFYLCGNRSMIQELSEGLKARKVLEEFIKTDMFY